MENKIKFKNKEGHILDESGIDFELFSKICEVVTQDIKENKKPSEVIKKHFNMLLNSIESESGQKVLIVFLSLAIKSIQEDLLFQEVSSLVKDLPDELKNFLKNKGKENND